MILAQSRQNGTIRHLARLAREKKYRQETGEMVCEGNKMLREALSSGAELRTVLLRRGADPSLARQAEERGAALYCAEGKVFEAASSLETPQDVIFSCKSPVLCGELPQVSAAMLLDGVQDPGNMGTIMRTAEAFGLEALILCEGCTDPTAPKVLRATMGAVFRQPLYRLPAKRAAAALKGQGLALYAASLDADSIPVTALRLDRCAVVVGNEGNGVSAELLALCDRKLILPMSGRAESLNAGVAAALLIWEVVRSKSADFDRGSSADAACGCTTARPPLRGSVKICGF